MVFNWTLIESKWYYNEWNGGFFLIRNIYNIDIIIIARSGIKAHSRQNGSQVEIEKELMSVWKFYFLYIIRMLIFENKENFRYLHTKSDIAVLV